jgi:hypothetical protein
MPKPTVYLTERESKMLHACWEYSNDPFGAPNHLLMMTVVALAVACEEAGIPIEIVPETR